MNEQKKSKKLKICLLLIIVIAGIAIATVTANKSLENLVRSGTVEVESINLQLIDQQGNATKQLENWDPGDVDLITWKVKNTGTAAVYTRNKLRIYWNEEIEDQSQVLYLYPANMSKSEILEDVNKGEESKYAINANYEDIQINDTTTRKGIEYEFYGDILDGSEMIGKSQEVNYDIVDFAKKTDDTSTEEDDISFNILLSPQTSYLFGDKTLTIEVVTEAMQCTEDGKAEWQIVDTQSIGN